MTLDKELIENARDGNLEKVRDLLRRGANVNAKDGWGSTALICASYDGHLEVVRALLMHNGVDVNIQNNGGNTALIYASEKGHLEVVRMLLKHDGVDVNIQDKHGITALMWASWNGHLDVVRAILMHNGVDVNIQNKNGRTALIQASVLGHLEVVRALLMHNGVDVNIKDNDGKTALDLARKKNKDDVARLLEEHMERLGKVRDFLKRGANVNAMNRDGDNALIEASKNGRLEVVRALLNQDSVNVNATNINGDTALIWASGNGHVEVVRALLLQNGVDLHISNIYGFTALDFARTRRNSYVVRLLEEHMQVHWRGDNIDWRYNEEEVVMSRLLQEQMELEKRRNKELLQALEEKRLRRELFEQDYTSLRNAMNTTSSDPVELSLDYIKAYLTSHKLGSGAFGDSFLADDSHLPKKFVVKVIGATTHFHADSISTLKKFRHPNMSTLYGYSLNANSTQQCLVYEHAANGSLAGFFTDDGNRARLSADIRLSIMYEMTRAVHFLHTGGCEGWQVCHRDIKSENIFLAEGFSVRLIDCGLAKFAAEEKEHSTSTIPGNVCDVYCIGVVIVELILGCLNGGKSSRNGMHFDDVFRRYVKDERGRLIVNGWEKLMRDADPAIIWDSGALELACKIAISCMAPSSGDRLSTDDLLSNLSEAISLNAKMEFQNSESEAAGQCGPCAVCNRNFVSIKCSEGHKLCKSCVEETLLHDLSGGCQLSCLIKDCSSEPIHDRDIYGFISFGMYNLYIERRDQEKMLNKYFSQFKSQMDSMQSQLYGLESDVQNVQTGVDESNARLQKQQKMLQELAKGLHRSLAALALLSASQFKECPNLVWMTPVSVETKFLRKPKMWFTQKYSVVFICAHSHEPGHEPFEIEVPKGWIAKIAPWLKLCLQVLNAIASSQALPFPIPNLPFFDQCEMMKTFLDSAVEEASNAVIAHCEALLESGTMTIDTYGQMQTLAGDAFKFIAEKARKEKRSQWKPPQMVPVCNHNGTPIWVKGCYQAHYGVSVDV